VNTVDVEEAASLRRRLCTYHGVFGRFERQ
jgi:hypothetical protein